MQKGDLKKETEGLITAAQDRAFRTNPGPLKGTSKGKITHSSAECVEFKEESVGHLISECSKLAQNEY